VVCNSEFISEWGFRIISCRFFIARKIIAHKFYLKQAVIIIRSVEYVTLQTAEGFTHREIINTIIIGEKWLLEGVIIRMETRKYSQIDIRVPAHRNSLLEKTLALINEDVEIKTLWRINNINAIDRLGMTDHGVVHFQIVANIALRLARILTKNQVMMSITRNYDLSNDYAELVILLASLFHDLACRSAVRGMKNSA